MSKMASIFAKLTENMDNEDVAGTWNALVDLVRAYCFEENVDRSALSSWDFMCFIAQANADYKDKLFEELTGIGTTRMGSFLNGVD